MSLDTSVRYTAPARARRPPSTSHLVPTSMVLAFCGSNLGLAALLAAALSWLLAPPGGWAEVAYSAYTLPLLAGL
ncbi:hypothetical protein D3C71_2138730 [compost metagenome]